MLRVIVALVFVAWATEAYDFCSNEEQFYNIYRVGSKSCPCTKKNTGALRYANKRLEICNGEKYEAVCGRHNDRSELGSQDNPAHSCKEILEANPKAASGMYYLKSGSIAKAAYCYMGTMCGEKGWTMIMKINGHKRTFHYDSKLWSNQDVISPDNAKGGLDNHETKLHTYHSFSFDRLCLGIKTGHTTRWQRLNYAADSLYSVLRDGHYRPLTIGRNAWKHLIPGSSLQRNCNKEGFNVNANHRDKAKVRIGIIANQENDCNSPDSRIGFGGGGNFCHQDDSNTMGNTAKCAPDNGDRNTKSMGYIFASNVVLPEGAIGTRGNPAKSCADIQAKRRDAGNGMYYIKSGSRVERVYCYMGTLCGERGWTMILKANGHRGTFGYDSAFWRNHATFNRGGAAGGVDNQETKLSTYSNFPFNKLCIGMSYGGRTNWMPLHYKANSLFSVIADNRYRATTAGRFNWQRLIAGSSLQPHCNKEGFNANMNHNDKARIRIGIIANQENDCNSPDSRIGIGGGGNFCGQDASNSVGNEAKCGGDHGDKHLKAFGYVFAKTTSKIAPLGDHGNPASSCSVIRARRRGARSGVYHLKLHGQVVQTYCEMGSICGSGGWTMIMKLDGKHRTFHYRSGYWTHRNTYNPRAAAGGLNTHETKLATYHLFPFSSLCVGMRVGKSLKWLRIPYRASSLFALIADNKHRHTRLGRNAWKSLIPGSSLQRNCNMEGFNVNFQGRLERSEARIGIISNQENNCHSPDSRIAFGGGGSYCSQNDNHSVGNEARCNPDNGDRSTVGFGYIMAQ